ncbi:hypothetical protein E3N88_08936 [Mikania micrantha]|uniref:Uncharacterized protein n=1 Tax=Mikania micrantha TaxID=192012 RepID=A0A5N6PHN4_9ASTR|nr:hypothetical protein E3N88_08936 [Mikania micrantha]
MSQIIKIGRISLNWDPSRIFLTSLAVRDDIQTPNLYKSKTIIAILPIPLNISGLTRYQSSLSSPKPLISPLEAIEGDFEAQDLKVEA